MTQTPSLLVIVHQETSSPGLVGEKLRSRGYHLDVRCPARGQPLPETLVHHAGAIVFGGPMSANDDDTLPFIRQELDWIGMVLASGKPYLGICLGAQLLARVLGAAVSPHPEEQREIGYFPLQPTVAGRSYFPAPISVYHWHREGFAIPTSAIKLAAGEAFPNQAFCYDEIAFGLQFHPEITDQLIDEWTTKAADHLLLPGAQPRELHLRHHASFAPTVSQWLDAFLTRWLVAADWTDCQSA